MSVEEKRRREKNLLKEMIRLYCKKRHRSLMLCPHCLELLSYSYGAIERCPHMETKTFCSSCTSHCYKSDKREEIKEVMRFSGPRMLFRHPVLLLRHILDHHSRKGK